MDTAMRRLSSLFLFTGLLSSTLCHGQQGVSLYYYERPPYMVARSDGSVTGLTADVAAKAFSRAGIAFTWGQMPAKRQLATIAQNVGRDCGVGWFKNPEREAAGQFSHPIYRDRPPVVIARGSFVPSSSNLAQLLQDPNVQVLIKESLTYGDYIRGLLKHARAKVTAITVEQPQLVRMIAAGRADIMFAPREEADFLATGHESGQESVHVLNFADVPTGDFRYIYCSKQIDSATMARLNAAIDQLAP